MKEKKIPSQKFKNQPRYIFLYTWRMFMPEFLFILLNCLFNYGYGNIWAQERTGALE